MNFPLKAYWVKCWSSIFFTLYLLINKLKNGKCIRENPVMRGLCVLANDGSTKQLFSGQITSVFTILNFELPIVKSPGDEILSNHHIFWPVNVDSSYRDKLLQFWPRLSQLLSYFHHPMTCDFFRAVNVFFILDGQYKDANYLFLENIKYETSRFWKSSFEIINSHWRLDLIQLIQELRCSRHLHISSLLLQ